MSKVFILIMTLLLCGCADYATNATVDGARKPSDFMPQPFPDAPVDARN